MVARRVFGSSFDMWCLLSRVTYVMTL